jgi:hypothetical protein
MTGTIGCRPAVSAGIAMTERDDPRINPYYPGIRARARGCGSGRDQEGVALEGAAEISDRRTPSVSGWSCSGVTL